MWGKGVTSPQLLRFALLKGVPLYLRKETDPVSKTLCSAWNSILRREISRNPSRPNIKRKRYLNVGLFISISRVVNTPASHSGGLSFKSRSGDRPS
jgi:hypothetical protein